MLSYRNRPFPIFSSLPLLGFGLFLRPKATNPKPNKGKDKRKWANPITNLYVKWRTAKDLIFFFSAHASFIVAKGN